MCKYNPGDELSRGFRQIGESRYQSPPTPMPAITGMANPGKTMGLQFLTP